jgi:uncharacterized membrane protein
MRECICIPRVTETGNKQPTGGLVSHSQTNDRGLYLLITLLLLYSLIFSAIAVWRYEHFLSFDHSGDQLLFEQVIYNTAHGKPFYNNFSHQSHFGDHNSPILGLLAPFTYMVPAPYVLSIFTVLSIAVAAIPIYLLSKELIGNVFIALLLSVEFLMLPALIGQVIASFHEINLVIPFLTFTFYFFVKKRFSPFIAMLVMSLLVKEDVALTTIMFSLYAIINKRERCWYIIPAIISISWFIISIKVIIPFYNNNNTYSVGVGYFKNIGSSLSDIIINIISKPLKIFNTMLSLENMWYIYIILLPAGLILPLFSTEIIFCLPSLIFNTIAENTRFRLYKMILNSEMIFIPRHMSIIAAIFIFIAAIYTIKKIYFILPKRYIAINYIIILLMLLVILFNDRYIFNTSTYNEVSKPNNDYPSPESIKNIISLIPHDKTVKSDMYISSHLFDRKESYYPTNNSVESDYIVATKLDESRFSSDYHDLITSNYILVAYNDNVSLYKAKALAK